MRNDDGGDAQGHASTETRQLDDGTWWRRRQAACEETQQSLGTTPRQQLNTAETNAGPDGKST